MSAFRGRADLEERKPRLPVLTHSGHRDASRSGTLGNIRRLPSDQSALMPANVTTLAHFPVSSAMNLAKSEGEPGSTVAPRSASRPLCVGSSRLALIALF